MILNKTRVIKQVISTGKFEIKAKMKNKKKSYKLIMYVSKITNCKQILKKYYETTLK